MLVRFFPSQPSMWIGLLPQLLVRLVLLRRVARRRAEPRRVLERPHRGRLLYERRYGFPYERFRSAAAAFIADRIPQARSDRR